MPGPFLGQALIGGARNVVNGLILERKVKKKGKKRKKADDRKLKLLLYL